MSLLRRSSQPDGEFQGRENHQPLQKLRNLSSGRYGGKLPRSLQKNTNSQDTSVSTRRSYLRVKTEELEKEALIR